MTLDPVYDTPFVMTREARRFGADSRVWRFASGRAGAVRALMRAFGVVTIRDEAGVPDEHTTFVYVLDADGSRVRCPFRRRSRAMPRTSFASPQSWQPRRASLVRSQANVVRAGLMLEGADVECEVWKERDERVAIDPERRCSNSRVAMRDRIEA